MHRMMIDTFDSHSAILGNTFELTPNPQSVVLVATRPEASIRSFLRMRELGSTNRPSDKAEKTLGYCLLLLRRRFD